MGQHVNRVEIIGNVGRDPEVKHTSDGRPIVNLSIATNEKWTDAGGIKHERTEWHRVTCFNEKLGEVIQKHVAKGQLLRIVGNLQTRKWQADDGSDRWTTEIIMRAYGAELTLLGGKPVDRDPDNARDAA